MSNNKMLIDATHPEETRVVVLRGGRVEEFDFESAARKLLRGNIYLAKVTRVEPSLQAAFVEYGGNRHGFLAFNEIHPDYYQIPMADRQALIEEEAAAEAEEEAAVDAHAEALARRRRGRSGGEDGSDHHSHRDAPSDGDHDGDHDEHGPDGDDADPAQSEPRTIAAAMPEDDRIGAPASAANEDESFAANENTFDGSSSEAHGADEAPEHGAGGEGGVHEVESNGAQGDVERVEQVGSGEDALEELPSRPRRRPRSYKIQEVIKRRQVILVQVVKEERGNKGAALTTYLSLAGRYTVLMPNTARGGGISRKITQPQDRKRLKAIAGELEVPEGMGLIIRTAGAARTKQEIKRDFEYLLRLWESVRDLTLQSQAPSLVYEEGNLIKRSIRDLYNKDVEEVVVAGDVAYREAKDFMRMLMPSHAKNVIAYQEPEPLFTKFQIERQLNAMFSPYVTLRSGGYLVINQTEALVAIDVNSGKATREFSIEETAHNTNLEASDEIARQLKLRDLAGLIVIDFIDMEEKRNNRNVERRLKEALRFDRARIQVGRISHFGLMEMSRQRLRTGVLEGSTTQCPHCQGTGIIRSTESVALAVLRGLEDAITAGARTALIAMTTPSVALYILNNKRSFINDMETRHGHPITVTGSEKLAGANFTIEKGAAPALPQRRTERVAVNMDWGFEGEDEPEGEVDASVPVEAREVREVREVREPHSEERTSSEEPRRRRRRRRRGSGRGERADGEGASADVRAGGGYETDDTDQDNSAPDNEPVETFDDDEGGQRADSQERSGQRADGPRTGEQEQRGQRNRRRGRRGGRRGRDRQPRTGENEQSHGTGEQPEIAARARGGSSEQRPFEERPFAADPAGGRPRRSEERPFEERPFEAEPAGARPRRSEERPAQRRPREPEPAFFSADSYAASPSEAHVEQTARPEPESAAEPAAPKRPRQRAGASEPRLERIVVGKSGDDAAKADVAQDAAAPPTRKGWWQRRLSGD